MKCRVSVFAALTAIALAVAPAAAQTPPVMPDTAIKPIPLAPSTANQPATTTPAANGNASRDSGYILGPDDAIEVSVLGQPEFTTRARIRTDGTVVLPYVGSTSVSGETTVSLSKRLAGVLKAGGYYSNPIVSVEIAGFASRYVIVLGSVAQPGLQPVDRPYRVSEIIARSGGIRGDGADFVIVRREKGEELKLPFEKLAKGDASDDPFVSPGDKVYVPQAETYYIYGQINSPGIFPIRDKLTLRKAIARSGGLGAAGSEKKISVYRDGKKTTIALDTAILPDDVIVVGQRSF